MVNLMYKKENKSVFSWRKKIRHVAINKYIYIILYIGTRIESVSHSNYYNKNKCVEYTESEIIIYTL